MKGEANKFTSHKTDSGVGSRNIFAVELGEWVGGWRRRLLNFLHGWTLGWAQDTGSMKSSDIKARVRRWLCKYVMWIKKPQRMGKVKHSYHEETIARHTRMMMISKKWATYQQAWMNGWLPPRIVGTLHTFTLTNCDWVGEGDRESNGKSHGKFTFIVGLCFNIVSLVISIYCNTNKTVIIIDTQNGHHPPGDFFAVYYKYNSNNRKFPNKLRSLYTY